MKKIINKKSYNTNYDSVCVAKYVMVVDGWASTKYYIFKKKSTGEFFEYSKWSEWNDGWDIKLVSADYVKCVIAQRKKGMTHRYCAVMANMPGTRKRGYFWGVESENPWTRRRKK